MRHVDITKASNAGAAICGISSVTTKDHSSQLSDLS